MNPELPECSTCRFWGDPDGNPLHGQCRRRAPIAVLSATSAPAAWPWTSYDDGCGEHCPREGAPLWQLMSERMRALQRQVRDSSDDNYNMALDDALNAIRPLILEGDQNG